MITKKGNPMSSSCEVAAQAGAPLGIFERYLTVWVFLCIVAGTLLGLYAPAATLTLSANEARRLTATAAIAVGEMARAPLSLAAVHGRRIA